MCYCTPNLRTPFCDKCPWKMAEELKNIGIKNQKLLSFVKEIAFSLRIPQKANKHAFELLQEIREIGEA